MGREGIAVVSPASGKGLKMHTFFPPVDSSTATIPPSTNKMTEREKENKKQNRTPLILQTFVLLGLADFPG